MKFILTAAISLFSFATLADCRLESPIDIKNIDLDKGTVTLKNVETDVSLGAVLDYPEEETSGPLTIDLFYVVNIRPGSEDAKKSGKFIGARINRDRDYGVGPGELYETDKVERLINESHEGTYHTVTDFESAYLGGSTYMSVLRQKSEILIKDNQILGIEFVNRVPGKFNRSMCVTKASL